MAEERAEGAEVTIRHDRDASLEHLASSQAQTRVTSMIAIRQVEARPEGREIEVGLEATPP